MSVSLTTTGPRRKKGDIRRDEEPALFERPYSRWAPVPANSPLIEGALSFWQPQSPRHLTREDAREIIENMTGFFAVLLEWELSDRKLRSRSEAAPGAPNEQDLCGASVKRVR